MSLTPGVSSRMGATLQSLLPLAGVLGAGTVTAGEIDLATGENLLLKDELLELCQKTMAHNLTVHHVSSTQLDSL
jgi:hypothetical protein